MCFKKYFIKLIAHFLHAVDRLDQLPHRNDYTSVIQVRSIGQLIIRYMTYHGSLEKKAVKITQFRMYDFALVCTGSHDGPWKYKKDIEIFIRYKIYKGHIQVIEMSHLKYGIYKPLYL